MMQKDVMTVESVYTQIPELTGNMSSVFALEAPCQPAF